MGWQNRPSRGFGNLWAPNSGCASHHARADARHLALAGVHRARRTESWRGREVFGCASGVGSERVTAALRLSTTAKGEHGAGLAGGKAMPHRMCKKQSRAIIEASVSPPRAIWTCTL
jgi:hypothetical protein